MLDGLDAIGQRLPLSRQLLGLPACRLLFPSGPELSIETLLLLDPILLGPALRPRPPALVQDSCRNRLVCLTLHLAEYLVLSPRRRGGEEVEHGHCCAF